MDARELHQQAVALAIQEVQEFQTLLGVAQEKADNAVAAVLQAIGESSSVSTGLRALGNTADARDKLPEMIGQAEAAIQDLRAYGQGF